MAMALTAMLLAALCQDRLLAPEQLDVLAREAAPRLEVATKEKPMYPIRVLTVLTLAALAGCIAADSVPGDGWAKQRTDMVERQVAARGVKNERVLAALRKVPRHEYVPEDMRAQAYADRPLPIGEGQTISQPYIVGYMTEVMDPKPGQRVLEVGT